MEDQCNCINLIQDGYQKICLDCGLVLANNCVTFDIDYSNKMHYPTIYYRSNGKERGRAKGIKKDPNRRRVKNPNGRLIDFEGPQYNKLISNGYVLDEGKGQLVNV